MKRWWWSSERAPIFPFYCYELYIFLLEYKKNRWISPCLFCTRNKNRPFSQKKLLTLEKTIENSQSFFLFWLEFPFRRFSEDSLPLVFTDLCRYYLSKWACCFYSIYEGGKISPYIIPFFMAPTVRRIEHLVNYIIKQYPVACFLNWVLCAIFLLFTHQLRVFIFL